VVTQPDKPAGRGKLLTPPPVKIFAESCNLPVLQPGRLMEASFEQSLRRFEPQVIAVAAYGRLIPNSILELPPWGCLNVHFSLLPQYRGASCVAAALLNGEKETGVSLMKIVEKLDAGPVYLQEKTPIGPEETTEDLEQRLSISGARLLLEGLERLEVGTLQSREQDESQMTYAPLLQKDDGRIDWNRRAPAIHDHIRAMVPWPVAFTHIDKTRLKIYRSRVVEDTRETGGGEKPGTVLHFGREGIEVACGQGRLRITELQPESKRRMESADFLHGHAGLLKTGSLFS
jgi:methionyl-tRNA formyltransferase